jgi:putative ABC transport system permease protein
MPENNKNLCDGRTKNLIDALGKTYYNPDNPLTGDSKFFIAQKDSDEKIIGYILNNNTCIDDAKLFPPPLPVILDIEGVLNPEFITFINNAYEHFSFNGGSLLDNDYQVTYNKIPLKPADSTNNILGDETYTYIDATGDKNGSTFSSKKVPPEKTRIIGIKDNSEYVQLLNSDGKNLKPLIDSSKCNDPNSYPLIVNAFAAHKYNLKIGDKMAFDVNNGTDRIQKKIDKDTSINKVIFNIVGINTTYQGEEYFTNQQLANKILGLRSSLVDFSQLNKTLHNYYPNSESTPIIPDTG